MEHLNKNVGNYTLIRIIGEGGMATVYEGIHATLGLRAAVKVLNNSLLNNVELRERFRNEAKVMATLDHPNIVKVFEYQETNDTLAIVMEYLEGVDLKEMVKEQGPIAEDIALNVLLQALNAFDYAHRFGIVHRDIKPSNIFILPNGLIKILDFGIAKVYGSNLEMTQTGTQMGTPVYMSPEQVQAKKDINYLSDIYSLGVMFNFALQGKPPYDTNVDSQYEIYNKIVKEKFPAYDGKYSDLILKACQKKPINRFEDCRQFIVAIEKVISGEKLSLKLEENYVEPKSITKDAYKNPPVFYRVLRVFNILNAFLVFSISILLVYLFYKFNETKYLFWFKDFDTIVVDQYLKYFYLYLAFIVVCYFGNLYLKKGRVFSILTIIVMGLNFIFFNNWRSEYDNFWSPIKNTWVVDNSNSDMISVVGVSFNMMVEDWAKQEINLDSLQRLKVKYLFIKNMNLFYEKLKEENYDNANLFMANDFIDLNDGVEISNFIKSYGLNSKGLSLLSRHGFFSKLSESSQIDNSDIFNKYENNSNCYYLRYGDSYALGLWDGSNLNSLNNFKFITIKCSY